MSGREGGPTASPAPSATSPGGTLPTAARGHHSGRTLHEGAPRQPEHTTARSPRKPTLTYRREPGGGGAGRGFLPYTVVVGRGLLENLLREARQPQVPSSWGGASWGTFNVRQVGLGPRRRGAGPPWAPSLKSRPGAGAHVLERASSGASIARQDCLGRRRRGPGPPRAPSLRSSPRAGAAAVGRGLFRHIHHESGLAQAL